MICVNGSQLANFPSNTRTEIIKSFLATVDDEVSVPRGCMVISMHKDTTNQWIYVKRADGQHGYVPDFICSLLLPYNDLQQLPERPKISRRKSQQIKKELKKFHKREFEKRTEQLIHQRSTLPSRSNHSALKLIYHSTNKQSSIKKVPSSMILSSPSPHLTKITTKMHNFIQAPPLNSRPNHTLERNASRKSIRQTSNNSRTLGGTTYGQQDEGLRHNGLLTLERAKPRIMPTLSERQKTMNDNLRRFLESLPPLENSININDHERKSELLCAEGKNIHYEAKNNTRSNPNLNKIGLNPNEATFRKTKSQIQLSVSDSNFSLTSELLKSTQQTQNLEIKNDLTKSKMAWRPDEPVVQVFIAIKDFMPETKIDLEIHKGDRITTVFNAVNGWLWASHTTSKAQGFVPISTLKLAQE